MKKLFEIADDYIKQCSWKDISLLKFCLCAFGFMLGLSVEKKYKKPAMAAALCIFCVTYVPLMAKFFDVCLQRFKRARVLTAAVTGDAEEAVEAETMEAGSTAEMNEKADAKEAETAEM